MPTYLGTPVFAWPVDWSNPVNGQWQYDLRQSQLGFGVETIDPVQDFVVTGWDFTTTVREDDIPAIDTFLDGLNGRATPFWLPGPPAFAKITAGVSSTRFKVREQGVSASLSARPELFLSFSKDGETDQRAKVLSAADNSDGTETVTLTAGLSVPVDESWQVSLLLLVRLAEDVEQVDVRAERYQVRSFRAVEVPNDYASLPSAPAPAAPLFLYRFTAQLPDGTVEWNFTSNPTAVVLAGRRWLPRAIEHDGLTRSTKLGGTVNISADFDTVEPLRLCIPARLAVRLHGEILRSDSVALTAPVSVFSGVVRKPTLYGKRVKATILEFGDMLDSNFPGFFIQSDCNYHLFAPATCKLDKNAFSANVTVSAQAGRTLTVTGAALAGKVSEFYSGGWLEVNAGPARLVLFVGHSEPAVGTSVDITVSDLVVVDIPSPGKLFPGCDGQRATCISKFNNLVNFGGHTIPLTNLTLSAIQTNPSAGGKK